MTRAFRSGIAIIFLAVITVYAFQNCSQPGSITSNVQGKSGEDSEKRVVDETFTKSFEVAPIDILFVIDDSVSMNAIIEQVREGFDSLSDASYPENTRMAVTYMAPALFIDDEYNFNLNQPWYAKALPTPGYLKLVNKESLQSYRDQVSDANSSKMNIEGCVDSWFAPSQKNAVGVSCLTAATQAPFYPIGVEAGVISLFQLVKKTADQNKSLFRKSAFANVIFVSDTHEPGAQYWGKPGALSQQLTPDQIVDHLQKYNEGLSSIKFHGIVPLPPVGDSRLDGLVIEGDIPATLEDSKVSNEELNDFSYLKFISETNGIVSHATNTNWSNIAKRIVEDSVYTGKLILETQSKIEELLGLKINDEVIDLNLVQISSDRKSIIFEYRSSRSEELKIALRYTTAEM